MRLIQEVELPRSQKQNFLNKQETRSKLNRRPNIDFAVLQRTKNAKNFHSLIAFYLFAYFYSSSLLFILFLFTWYSFYFSFLLLLFFLIHIFGFSYRILELHWGMSWVWMLTRYICLRGDVEHKSRAVVGGHPLVTRHVCTKCTMVLRTLFWQ